MKLIKIYLVIVMLVYMPLNAKDKPMNINFQNLKIEDLIKITSKVLGKNILLNQAIPGNVDFISNKDIYEKDLFNILVYVLEEKGFTIVDNNDILRVVRIGEASKYNLPVSANDTPSTFSMVTNVFPLVNLNVDYVASKVVHLIGKSGRVVTDKVSNSLIVTDFPDNIETIKQVIDYISLDKQKDVQMITLQYTQAQTLSTELKNLAKAIFDETIDTQKVEILVNKDTNSIILVGKESNIKVLKEFVDKIDVKGSLAEHITEVIGLKNTEAKSIMTLIDSILSKKVYPDPASKPFVGSDEETNTIVVMGAKSEVDNIKDLINKLDIDRPQVYVKAQIIEISDRRSQTVGMQYGIVGGGAGSDGLVAMAANLGSVTNVQTMTNLLNSGIAGIKIPSGVDAVVGLNATINLLKSNGAAESISEPSILAINNKESSIYVGERRSIKTGTVLSDTSALNNRTTYAREDIGLTLKVKPRISNDDKVILEIKALLEGVSGGDADTPTTTKKEVNTSAIVNNGESVILGGLIQNVSGETVTKIPLLGDIPVLGQLFRNNVDTNDKVSLVVILTPYIVSKSSDLAQVRQYLSELAQIEDKMLKDLEVRYQENLIKQKKDDAKRDKKSDKLQQKIDKLDGENKTKETKSNYEQTVNSVFGL